MRDDCTDRLKLRKLLSRWKWIMDLHMKSFIYDKAFIQFMPMGYKIWQTSKRRVSCSEFNDLPMLTGSLSFKKWHLFGKIYNWDQTYLIKHQSMEWKYLQLSVNKEWNHNKQYGKHILFYWLLGYKRSNTSRGSP